MEEDRAQESYRLYRLTTEYFKLNGDFKKGIVQMAEDLCIVAKDNDKCGESVKILKT
ncbi:MAG: hypothetical protein Ta2B_20330 [Termitinemataceae bacterium]|nr:MAG: hypothetical protein Ta2B_20330 [Termitinemataceae bacterium]